MIRIGYAPGAYDLFHIGHLNLLKSAKQHCDYLVVGVVADAVLIEHKGVTPVIPLAERLEIVRSIRFVDAAHAAMTNDKVAIWKDLKFNVLFKGDDWRGTATGDKLERDFGALGVEVLYLPYTLTTSSSALRKTLANIDVLAGRGSVPINAIEAAHAPGRAKGSIPTGVRPSRRGVERPPFILS